MLKNVKKHEKSLTKAGIVHIYNLINKKNFIYSTII